MSAALEELRQQRAWHQQTAERYTELANRTALDKMPRTSEWFKARALEHTKAVVSLDSAIHTYLKP